MIGWPVIDRIGPVSPHGLGIAVGYLAGSWWMLREGRKRGVNEDHVGTILLWALVGAIVGARLFYVLGHLEDFESVAEMLRIWEGGISLIGGIAGGVGFAYPILRRYGYRFLQVMDSAAIGLAFGIFVGRIGDLVIGDHLGKPTDFALGWQYRGGDLPGPWSGNEATGWIAPLEEGLVQQITVDGATLCRATPDGFGCAEIVQQGSAVHQTALYDFLIAGLLFLFLRWLSRRPRREGVLILSFAILYGAGRVVTDFLRVDKTWLGLGLTGSQLTAIGVILLSLLTLLRFSRRPLPAVQPQLPSDEVVGVGPPDRGPGVPHAPEVDGATGSTTDFVPPPEPGHEAGPPLETERPVRPEEPSQPVDETERPARPEEPSHPSFERERPPTDPAASEPTPDQTEAAPVLEEPAEPPSGELRPQPTPAKPSGPVSGEEDPPTTSARPAGPRPDEEDRE